MATSFLPRKDADLLLWAQAFSSQITATPTAFGLVSGQATAFATLFSTFQTAMNVANNDSTRTRGSIAAKDDAARALRVSAGNLSKIIEGTPSVTNQQKLNLGLNVRAMPSPKPVPAAAPVLEVVTVIGRLVKIRLHEVQSGSSRGRPANTNGATILSHVGAAAPSDISGWKFEGNTGKTINDIVFPADLAPGATVWLTAFWVGSRMESGPACNPVSVTFGATGVQTLAA